MHELVKRCLINRLLKRYEVDEEFLEEQWTDNQLEEIKVNYHLKGTVTYTN